MKAINRCRLFQKVATLTDILNLNGEHIRHELLIPQLMIDTNHKWPHQQKPPKSDWILWKQAIQEINGWYRSKSARKISEWNKDSEKWEWFLHVPSVRIYQKTKNGWKFYVHHGRGDRPTAGYYTGPFDTNEHPNPLRRAGISKGVYNHRLYCTDYQTEISTIRNRANNTLEMGQMINTADPSTQYLLRNLQYTDKGIRSIAQSIQAGEARLVSDGSFLQKRTIVTFAFIIENKDSTHQISASQTVPGNPEDQDAYRAESTGLLAGIMP